MSYVERYEYILLDHLHELAHRKIVDVDPERVLDLARSRLDPEEAVSWGSRWLICTPSARREVSSGSEAGHSSQVLSLL